MKARLSLMNPSYILHKYDPSYISSYQPTFLRYEKENDTIYLYGLAIQNGSTLINISVEKL